MANADVLRRLWRYKSDVEENPDEEKLIEILGKLKQIPVTVATLQETGMGKLLNRLSKQEGFAGVKAAEVVKQWKTAVVKEVDKASKTANHHTHQRGSSACRSSNVDTGSGSDSSSRESYEKKSTKVEASRHKTHEKEREKHRSEKKHHSAREGEKVSSSLEKQHHIKKEHATATKTLGKSAESSKTQEDHRHRSSHQDSSKNSVSSHHSSHKDKNHRHHSSSKEHTRGSESENRNSSSKKDYSDSHPTSKHKSKKSSEDEELTDSDEALGEESAVGLNIEDYFKKTLEQNAASTPFSEKSKHLSSSRKESQGISAKESSYQRGLDDSGYKSQHRENKSSSSRNRSQQQREVERKSSSSVEQKEHRKESSHTEKKSSSNSASSHSQSSKDRSSSSHRSNSSSTAKNGSSLNTSEREKSSSEKSRSDHKKVERKRKQHSVSDSEEESPVSPPKQHKIVSSMNIDKHKNSKDSRSSKSSSQSHSSQKPSVKKEKLDNGYKYGAISIKTEKLPNHAQRLAAEDLHDLEEELYSPTHVTIKKEKSWSPTPAPHRPRYSPTPISRDHKIKSEASDDDSLSAGSLSPTTGPAQTHSGQSLHSDSENETALRYSPQKLAANIKQESSSSSVSSRETTPSYNPTPIKKERSASPNPSHASGNSDCERRKRKHSAKDKARLPDKDRKRSSSSSIQVKAEPFASYAQSSSDEDRPPRRSSQTSKSKGKSLIPPVNSSYSHSRSQSPDSNYSHSPDSHGHLSQNSDSNNENSRPGSVASAVRSHSASPAATSTDHEDLTDSDVSHSEQTYEPTPLNKHNTSTGDKTASLKKIKTERFSPALSSPLQSDNGNSEDEEDKYTPFSLSNKVKEEPYSPTPKLDSSKYRSKEKSLSHTNSHKYSHSNSKSSHSQSSKSSVEHKSELSKERYSSSKHSSNKEVKSSHLSTKSSSEKAGSSNSHEIPRHISASARNSPAAQSDISLISSSSYPGVRSKHHSSQKHHHSSSSTKDEKIKDSQQKPSKNLELPSSVNNKISSTKEASESKTSSSHKSHSKSSSRHNHDNVSTNASKSKDSTKTAACSDKPGKLSSCSGHKKSKPLKQRVEEPELDLFSDAISFKSSDLNLKPKPKVKLQYSPAPKSSRVSDSESPPQSRSTSVSPTPVSSHNVSAKAKSGLKSTRKWDSESPSPSPSPSASPIPEREQARSTSGHKSSTSKRPYVEDSLFNTGTESEGEERFVNHTPASPKKHKAFRDETEEAQMSFEDFMNVDSALLLSKGKNSAKTSSKTKKVSSHSSSRSQTSSKSKSSSGSSSSRKESASAMKSTYSSASDDFYVPTPLKKVKVTELDILSSLPETQAHYRPLPPRRSGYGEDDDFHEESVEGNLEDIGLRKLTRTHMYSGRRQGVTEVKSLFDMCIQLLIENIDALDCVGGVPYDVLKPVLERCTAQQLYHLEDYNPHFLEDTDELWEKLCHRDFRGCKPDELELWREMYLRKHNEREVKYQKLKETMSSSIVKGQAGRKAQLAYVDTPVKAPRDVLRRQMKYGTGCVKMTKGPGAVAGVKPYKPSVAVPVYNPMNDRQRVIKPVAPMMARAIQMRKNLRR